MIKSHIRNLTLLVVIILLTLSSYYIICNRRGNEVSKYNYKIYLGDAIRINEREYPCLHLLGDDKYVLGIKSKEVLDTFDFAIRISPDGQIENAHLVRSTGDKKVDKMILKILKKLRFSECDKSNEIFIHYYIPKS